jgi:putative membrane protein
MSKVAWTSVPSTAPSAVATPTTPAPAGAPVAGANSFTESQALKRIEDQGYTNVMGLMKDSQSVWRGTAMKSGTSMAVALDYQGNVVGSAAPKP